MDEHRSVEDEILAEVAADLQLNEATLREALAVWLGHRGCVCPSLTPEYNAGCYAVYRLVKLRSAFKSVVASRDRWRDAAHREGIRTVTASRTEESPVSVKVGNRFQQVWPPSGETLEVESDLGDGEVAVKRSSGARQVFPVATLQNERFWVLAPAMTEKEES